MADSLGTKVQGRLLDAVLAGFAQIVDILEERGVMDAEDTQDVFMTMLRATGLDARTPPKIREDILDAITLAHPDPARLRDELGAILRSEDAARASRAR